jgi:hypothetical protein
MVHAASTSSRGEMRGLERRDLELRGKSEPTAVLVMSG